MPLIFGHDVDDDDNSMDIKNYMRGGAFTVTENCIATHITVKVNCDTEAKYYRCAIYGPTSEDESPTYAWTRLAATEELLVSADGIFWQTFEIPTGSRPTLVKNSRYWLVVMCKSGRGTGSYRVAQVTAGTGNSYSQSRVYEEGFPATSNCDILSLDGTANNDDLNSLIYCTYVLVTPSSGEAETIAPSTTPQWPRDTYLSGYPSRFRKTQQVGYFGASGDLRSLQANASGHAVVVQGACPKVRTGQPVALTSASGGVSIVDQWCSGHVHQITVKALSGEIFLGDSGCRPYIGYGYSIANRETIKIDIDNPANIYGVAVASGSLVGFIGTDYINQK